MLSTRKQGLQHNYSTRSPVFEDNNSNSNSGSAALTLPSPVCQYKEKRITTTHGNDTRLFYSVPPSRLGLRRLQALKEEEKNLLLSFIF